MGRPGCDAGGHRLASPPVDRRRRVRCPAARHPYRGDAGRPPESRPRPDPARTEERHAWHGERRGCASSDPVAARCRSASSTDPSPGRTSTHRRPVRTPTASCWAARRLVPGPPTRTSRGTGRRATGASVGTTHAHRRCGWAHSRGGRADRVDAPCGSTPPRRRVSRIGGLQRNDRRRRIRSRRMESGRSGTTRWRRRRGSATHRPNDRDGQ